MIANPNEKFVELTGKYEKREITMEDLNKECAYWLLNCFSEVSFRPAPSAPNDYASFLEMPFEKRQKLSQEIHNHPTVKSHLEEKFRIKNENYSNHLKLKEFKEFIPKEDFVSIRKYTDKINDFEDRMANRGGAW